jgi:hypothetical protein
MEMMMRKVLKNKNSFTFVDCQVHVKKRKNL